MFIKDKPKWKPLNKRIIDEMINGNISVSPNLHQYIMDYKYADHKSAEAVIYGLIGENDGLKKEITRLVAENRKLKG